MNCIKCGRDLKGEQVFCSACQKGMEAYPVKRGTPVQLPIYTAPTENKPKTPRLRKSMSPEARLNKMRTANRLLLLALAASLLAFLLMSCLTIHLLDQRDRQSRIGQNYHVIAEE